MRRLLGAAALLCAAAGVDAENWPHWRGPTRDGVSTETDLPLRWGPDEGIAWKLPMPAWSGSTPIVWGDRVFVSTADGGERASFSFGRRGGDAAAAGDAAGRLSLWCIDRADGRVLWTRHLGSGNHQERKQNMSSPSPVTDGRRVWVMTGTGVLKAFDFEGRELWSRDIPADYGRFGLNWGYASSPTLHEGTLYVQVLHGMKTDDPSYVLAIDAEDGTTRWRVERPTDALRESPDAYTTPAVLRNGERTEIVVSGGDYVTGHDPATGRELWRAGGLNPDRDRNYRIVASAVVGDEMLFVPTRMSPLQAFRVAGGEPRLAWKTDDGPDVPTPVTDGPRLFVLRDNGVLFCLDSRSGQVIWGPRRVRSGTYSASPVLADGRLYVTSEDGVTSVVAAGPEFELLAENDLAGYTLSSMAISEGQIFLRTEDHLYCIGTRRPGH